MLESCSHPQPADFAAIGPAGLSRQLGDALSRAGVRCRPAKPAVKRPAGATKHKAASRFLLVLALALIVFCPGAARAQNPAAAEAQVRAVEQQVNAAYAANNLPLYFSFYAPDFTGWFPGSRTSLPAYKKEWTAEIAAGNRMLAVKLDDVHVQVSPAGDAAVASYILRIRQHSARGDVNEVYHETDVLFRRDGAWKIVEVHYSPARSPAPRHS